MTTVRLGSEPASDVGVYRSTSDADARRRAVRLCVAAEPHTGSVPCAGHLHQARSQLSLVGQAEEPEPT
ncbi:MAG: hypothetical protein ACR2LJ_10510 [Acidimicrobiales bacterium]